jgi:hypothetical protein
MSVSLAGAHVALFGEFSSMRAREVCRVHARANGAIECDLDAATLTHVIRGEITRRLADRIGASPRERELIRRGVIVLEESAWAPAALLTPEETAPGPLPQQVRSRASSAVVPPVDVRTIAAPLLDPSAPVTARHASAAALVAHGSPGALAALAESLRDDGMDRSIEARAFAQLVARGVSRFGRPAPFAIEFPLRRTRGTDERVEEARRLGAVDALCDDEGRRWCRVRLALPSSLAQNEASRASLVEFIDRVATRRHARVWLAGFALPAGLGHDAWTALLATLTRR